MQGVLEEHEAQQEAAREQGELNSMTEEQRDERLDAMLQAEADDAEREAGTRRCAEHEQDIHA